ncbi:MAG: MFS transporter, partial [Natronomonas sp.]
TVGTMAAIPLLDSILLVIVANAILWLGFAAAIPVLTLLVVSGEPEENWSGFIAKLNKYQGIGWAAGLAIGFVVIAAMSRVSELIVAQRLFFFVCAACAGIGLLIGLRTLPADPARGAEPTQRRLQRFTGRAQRFNIRGASFPFSPSRFDPRGLHPRRFVERFTSQLATYFLAVFLVFTGFGVFFAPLPAYLSDIGYGSDGIFALYLVLNVGAAVFYGQAALLVGRFTLIRTHVGGLLTRGVVFPTIAVAGAIFGRTVLGTGVVTLLFFVLGLTWAVIAVTAATLVTKLTPVVIRGEALGVYGALVAVGGGVGGLLGGSLASLGYTVVFGVSGGLVLFGVGVVFVLSRRLSPASTFGETPV